ncbi:IS66-like element accessory protein TnpA [Pandoraea oxalativorans]|nr:transposase [Pandoraea oxalativorans]
MVGAKVDKVLSVAVEAVPYRRANFSMEFKRATVEATLRPGASVALTARKAGINANLLFKWRRHYLAGAYGDVTPELVTRQSSAASVTEFVPVTITKALVGIPTPSADQAVPTSRCSLRHEGKIELVMRGGTMRFDGPLSLELLRELISELRT